MIGASGAISGVMGSYLVLHPRTKILVMVFCRLNARLPAIAVLGPWIARQVFQAGVDDGVGRGTARRTPIGGFLAGLVLIVPMRQKGVPLFDRGGIPRRGPGSGGGSRRGRSRIRASLRWRD